VKPTKRPARPEFASGPCPKRPGWSVQNLSDAAVGRSHRGKLAKGRIVEAIEKHRKVLGIPDDYKVGIVPASDTGAFEMAMWSLLGERGVDVLAWESFGSGWLTDVTKQLKLDNVRQLTADYGDLPDLGEVNFDNDVVFTWNGTTSGVCVPDGDWIAADRAGLTLCDATSAVFAMELPWSKLDVVTWSWQKVLGGEAAHGMLVLSPRAVERLESYVPPRPLPKVFRMTKGGKLIDGIFTGATINTPSLLCVEDVLDSLRWVEEIGGRQAAQERSRRNLAILTDWVEKTDWVEFLAKDSSARSRTSICFSIVASWFLALDEKERAATAKKMVGLLEQEGVAYDIGAYRDAPPGLRIWGGATVETSDLEALLPWLDWAFEQVKP
jgi:phosphoserine aminotransferase